MNACPAGVGRGAGTGALSGFGGSGPNGAGHPGQYGPFFGKGFGKGGGLGGGKGGGKGGKGATGWPCHQQLRTGACGFGAACRFAHATPAGQPFCPEHFLPEFPAGCPRGTACNMAHA